jgi:hypothetical protein
MLRKKNYTVKFKQNCNIPGKCFGIKSLNTTATKATHFPISPLHSHEISRIILDKNDGTKSMIKTKCDREGKIT